MSVCMTVFTATLVQDSALSIAGLDRGSSSDRPFVLVDGVPVIPGRGLKGAAVALARRCFDPLPRSVSEHPDRREAYRRSTWEFADARPEGGPPALRVRAGVKIQHRTGAAEYGLLHDREVVPAGTRWPLELRVDWSHARRADGEDRDDGTEAEGILGYVLAEHWAMERCWLGGDVARGLGWCHVEDLRAYRLDADAYERWVDSGRTPSALPQPITVPTVTPTRSWCFRTLDLTLSVGEYRPDGGDAWGVDMLAIGTDDGEQTVQPIGDGAWARPTWAIENPNPATLATDRSILMDRERPLLPGSSLRGPLRHALVRAQNARIRNAAGDAAPRDADDADRVFGSIEQSSRILIRDGRAEPGWAAARLHQHAEDEFSAGSYGSAKRNAVRLLRAEFPLRILVEGAGTKDVDPLVAEVDRLIALGALGHLPVGGHKTRGAGWGRWWPAAWQSHDVVKARDWQPARTTAVIPAGADEPSPASPTHRVAEETARVRTAHDEFPTAEPTLGELAAKAREALGERALRAWWCEPAAALTATAPAVFGRAWPDGATTRVDEAAFFAAGAVWRAARTAGGTRWVLVEEVPRETQGSSVRTVRVVRTPARLHANGLRFRTAAPTDAETIELREWHDAGTRLAFTLE